jgi:hypothetical protein
MESLLLSLLAKDHPDFLYTGGGVAVRKDFLCGQIDKREGLGLVLWLKAPSTKPVRLRVESK